MISVDEAYRIILENIFELPEKAVSLLDCYGMVLREDVAADYDSPPRDNSAMDGFAIISSDVADAGPEDPVSLRVIETIHAGYVPAQKVEPGCAARIMTGGIVPEGADTIVRVEDTEEVGGIARIYRDSAPGRDIRRAGEDFRKGNRLLRKGRILTAPDVGLLAMLGRMDVSVGLRPRVAILSSGDELIEPFETLKDGKIRNANSYSLAAYVAKYGGIPILCGIARDNPADIREKLERCFDEGDIVVSTAGVSMGERDLIRAACEDMGMDVKFWKVAMRPGKPIFFGTYHHHPFFGLPGNVVSCMVGFEVFIRPALLKMMGASLLDKPLIRVLMRSHVTKPAGLREYVRVSLECDNGDYFAEAVTGRGSGIITSMVRANGLLVMPEDVTELHIGDSALVYPLQ